MGPYYATVSKSNILQFAWKDQALVLFMSTVSEGFDEVIKNRRRPAATSTGGAKSRAPFGPDARKDLPIPRAIDLYNHRMGGVDQADQLRSYYHTQQTHMKGWKAIWSFLLDIVVINSYKLTIHGLPSDTPRTRMHGHKNFRQRLVRGLVDLSTNMMTTPRPPRRMPTKHDELVVPKSPSRHVLMLTKQNHACCLCFTSKSTATKSPGGPKKRKALEELSPNSMRNGERRSRPPRTKYQCETCHIPICRSPTCWDLHIHAVVEKRQKYN